MHFSWCLFLTLSFTQFSDISLKMLEMLKMQFMVVMAMTLMDTAYGLVTFSQLGHSLLADEQ